MYTGHLLIGLGSNGYICMILLLAVSYLCKFHVPTALASSKVVCDTCQGDRVLAISLVISSFC